MHIAENISLLERSWFRTGGTARFYCEPTDANDMQRALAFARATGVDVAVIGDGANLLINDGTFDALVIRPAATTPAIAPGAGKDELHVTAGAGVLMDTVIAAALDAGAIGLEDFSGIPGTVGGALFINLHYLEHFIADHLVRARIIECASGAVSDVTPDWFGFGYDTSALHLRRHVVLDAVFRVQRVSATDVAYARGRRAEIIRHRQRRYPTERTCGSFFRNFLPSEINFGINGQKILHVAYYLDKLGVKGELAVGDAVVSHKHANMIVNNGTATAADIVALARRMQTLLQARYGIVPQPECQLLGFAQPPLL
jgi:UDP-N-acetylmuramate dehydrogenase